MVLLMLVSNWKQHPYPHIESLELKSCLRFSCSFLFFNWGQDSTCGSGLPLGRVVLQCACRITILQRWLLVSVAERLVVGPPSEATHITDTMPGRYLKNKALSTFLIHKAPVPEAPRTPVAEDANVLYVNWWEICI